MEQIRRISKARVTFFASHLQPHSVALGLLQVPQWTSAITSWASAHSGSRFSEASALSIHTSPEQNTANRTWTLFFRDKLFPIVLLPGQLKTTKKRENTRFCGLPLPSELQSCSVGQWPGGDVLFVTEGHVLLGLSGEYPRSPSLARSLLLFPFGNVLAVVSHIRHGINRLWSCYQARRLGFWTPSGENGAVAPLHIPQVLGGLLTVIAPKRSLTWPASTNL